jgi:hypothetical protein
MYNLQSEKVCIVALTLHAASHIHKVINTNNTHFEKHYQGRAKMKTNNSYFLCWNFYNSCLIQSNPGVLSEKTGHLIAEGWKVC